MSLTFEGGCHCGRVRYRVTGGYRHADHCHCGMCRRGGGAVAATWVTVDSDKIEWTGEPRTVFKSSDTASRSFCSTCGSRLTFEYSDRPEEIDVSMGSMDDPNSIGITHHLYTDTRIPWVDLDPNVPVHPKSKPAETPPEEPLPVHADDRNEGGCLCGAVRYVVIGAPIKTAICHCETCRRISGGTAVAWGIWELKRFQHKQGPTTYYQTSANGGRRFCKSCGSYVYYDSRASLTTAEIMLSSLDNPGQFIPSDHAFAGSAPDWVHFDDDRTRWPGALNRGVPNDLLLRGR